MTDEEFNREMRKCDLMRALGVAMAVFGIVLAVASLIAAFCASC